jgi:hypothetical protein
MVTPAAVCRLLLSFVFNLIQILRQEVGTIRREKIISAAHWHIYKVLSFHDLVFMPFTIRIIEVLTCRNIPGGSSYVLSTPTVDCSSNVYTQSFVPLAAFSAVWYIVFYLIAYGAVFWHCRLHVEDNVYANSYGMWWIRYKPRYFWWQLVFTSRKFFLALCIGLLPEKPIYQMISSMSVWSAPNPNHVMSNPSTFSTKFLLTCLAGS